MCTCISSFLLFSSIILKNETGQIFVSKHYDKNKLLDIYKRILIAKIFLNWSVKDRLCSNILIIVVCFDLTQSTYVMFKIPHTVGGQWSQYDYIVS
jgi:hypothetical protein